MFFGVILMSWIVLFGLVMKVVWLVRFIFLCSMLKLLFSMWFWLFSMK